MHFNEEAFILEVICKGELLRQNGGEIETENDWNEWNQSKGDDFVFVIPLGTDYSGGRDGPISTPLFGNLSRAIFENVSGVPLFGESVGKSYFLTPTIAAC